MATLSACATQQAPAPRAATTAAMQPEIVGGTAVTANRQRELGLVTVNGGCSATLLDRFWLLTARHCVTVDGQIASALLAPAQVRITAAWAPGQTATATLIQELAPNRPTPGRDIILVLFGNSELGDMARQTVLARQLRTNDTVTQYGRGLNSFATGVWNGNPPAVLGGGGGTYRSGNFAPSSISGTAYELVMNAANQVGHGGDSGGPTWAIENGAHAGIAGVQSTCSPTGYIPNTPQPPQWPWATGIRACQYVSVEPLVREIEDARAFRNLNPLPGWQPGPPCPSGAGCVVPAILPILLDP